MDNYTMVSALIFFIIFALGVVSAYSAFKIAKG